MFRAAEFLNVTVHTLATYLSTLQGPDRISLTGDLSPAAASGSSIDGGGSNSSNTATTTNEPPATSENNESVNDILQKINTNAATSATLTATTTPIKREGGGYIEVPTAVPKAATSVLENNPDITIVKTEMLRKREYTKMSSTENNNAKLMSGGAVSEINTTQQQQQQQKSGTDALSLNSDSSKP